MIVFSFLQFQEAEFDHRTNEEKRKIRFFPHATQQQVPKNKSSANNNIVRRRRELNDNPIHKSEPEVPRQQQPQQQHHHHHQQQQQQLRRRRISSPKSDGRATADPSGGLVSELNLVVSRLNGLLTSGRRLNADLSDLHEGLGQVERRLERLVHASDRARRDLRDTLILDDMVRLLASDGKPLLAEDNVYIRMVQPRSGPGMPRANFLV